MLQAAVDELTAKISSAAPPPICCCLHLHNLIAMTNAQTLYGHADRSRHRKASDFVYGEEAKHLLLFVHRRDERGGGASSPSLSDPHFFNRLQDQQRDKFPSYLHIYCVFK